MNQVREYIAALPVTDVVRRAASAALPVTGAVRRAASAALPVTDAVRRVASGALSAVVVSFAALALSAAMPPSAVAASGDDEYKRVEDHPGYVDFSRLSALAEVEPMVEVSLKAPLLNMITNFIRENDEETAEIASKLLQVTVRVFEGGDMNLSEVAGVMVEIADELDDQGWERVVRVRDDEDHVDIYFRLSDTAEVIHGIAVMVAEPDEIVLVNVVGDINDDDIASLGRRFNIDELSDYHKDGMNGH